MEGKTLSELFSEVISKSEEELMHDSINYLRSNNILLFDSDGNYRGYDAIIDDVIRVENSKFENS